LQLGQTVPQPPELPIQVGSSQTASERSIRGVLPETGFQSLDLRVKHAQEGTIGMIALRRTRHWLDDRMSENSCAHRFLLLFKISSAVAVVPGLSRLEWLSSDLLRHFPRGS
jgi:hypothetical protein